MEENEKTTLPEIYTPTEFFRVDYTNEEAKAVALILPKGYSLQLDPRRKEKSQPKKKITQDLSVPLSEQLNKTKNVQTPGTVPPSKKGQPKAQPANQTFKICLKTLEQLKQHKCAWPFMEPVDVDGLNIPQYRQIIKQPMDLSTVESKLKGGKYQSPAQFHQDIVKIFHNSYTFNEAYEEFIKLTIQFEKYYYRISGEVKPPQDKTLIKPSQGQSKQQKKKKKFPPGSRDFIESQPMTTEQKRQLAFHLHRLAKEHIKGVRSIVFDSNSEQNEFNLQQLSQKKLRELQKYVRNKISQMQNSLHSSLLQKSQEQNLDELESQITEEFIEEYHPEPAENKIQDQEEQIPEPIENKIEHEKVQPQE